MSELFQNLFCISLYFNEFFFFKYVVIVPKQGVGVIFSSIIVQSFCSINLIKDMTVCLRVQVQVLCWPGVSEKCH